MCVSCVDLSGWFFYSYLCRNSLRRNMGWNGDSIWALIFGLTVWLLLFPTLHFFVLNESLPSWGQHQYFASRLGFPSWCGGVVRLHLVC